MFWKAPSFSAWGEKKKKMGTLDKAWHTELSDW